MVGVGRPVKGDAYRRHVGRPGPPDKALRQNPNLSPIQPLNSSFRAGNQKTYFNFRFCWVQSGVRRCSPPTLPRQFGGLGHLLFCWFFEPRDTVQQLCMMPLGPENVREWTWTLKYIYICIFQFFQYISISLSLYIYMCEVRT